MISMRTCIGRNRSCIPCSNQGIFARLRIRALESPAGTLRHARQQPRRPTRSKTTSAKLRKRACHLCPDTVKYLLRGDVAQLVRALRSHRRGRGFEPLHPHHNWTPILIQCVLRWVFISLSKKCPFVGLFRYYLTKVGPAAVFEITVAEPKYVRGHKQFNDTSLPCALINYSSEHKESE